MHLRRGRRLPVCPAGFVSDEACRKGAGGSAMRAIVAGWGYSVLGEIVLFDALCK